MHFGVSSLMPNMGVIGGSCALMKRAVHLVWDYGYLFRRVERILVIISDLWLVMDLRSDFGMIFFFYKKEFYSSNEIGKTHVNRKYTKEST